MGIISSQKKPNSIEVHFSALPSTLTQKIACFPQHQGNNENLHEEFEIQKEHKNNAKVYDPLDRSPQIPP